MSEAARNFENPEIRESHDLIGSDKVQGTKVYDRNGDHVGQIERIMLEKRGGRVSYAVLSFGGFFGIGHDHYPLPWEKLDYDEELGGYRVDITKEQVESAPKSSHEDRDWTPDRGREIYQHYGVAPYWI